MAKRIGFQGGSSNDIAGDVIKSVLRMQGTGETASPAGTTDGTSKFKSGPSAAIVAKRKKFLSNTDPYTAEQIAADPALAAIKGGITYEQALANYRKAMSVSNLAPMGGEGVDKAAQYDFQKAYNALTPEQKNAERIFTLLGGSTINAQGTGGVGGPSSL